MALFNVTSSGGLIHSFNSWITNITATTDGDIIVFGNFTTYNGDSPVSANGIIKLDYDGIVQTDFDYGTGFGTNYAFSQTGVVIDASNNVYVGGQFSTYNGTAAKNVVKLTSTGSIDGTFDYGTGFTGSGAYTLKPTLDDSGNVYYCGIRDVYDGNTTKRFTKINATTGVWDSTYNTNLTSFTNTTIQSIHAGSGVMFLHGYFTEFGHLTKITATGTVDGTFATGTGFNNANPNDYMDGLICNQTSNIVLIGNFTDYNSNTIGNIIRINATTGAIDSSFNNGGAGFAGGRPFTIAQSSTGQFLVAGSFTSYNGVSNNGLVLLDDDGSIDTGFNSDPDISQNIEYITRIGSTWFCALNDYVSKYYIIKIDDNGNKIYL